MCGRNIGAIFNGLRPFSAPHHRLVRPRRQQLSARQRGSRRAAAGTASRRSRQARERQGRERERRAPPPGPPRRSTRVRQARRGASRASARARVAARVEPAHRGDAARRRLYLPVRLVDERPEEVSEMIDWGRGEVIASSFDLSHERHVAVADMVFEHARRQVELGKDVVIVLDSLTRLARSHNTTGRGSGRTMSGGLDANALAKPKGLFGAARAVPPKDGGGSLTVIATALVETESKMDDIIFEEFKGTGNAELRLTRALADRRIYPAVDIAASGTRREELLGDAKTIEAKQKLRRGLVGLPPEQAMQSLLQQMKRAKTNAELLTSI